MSGGRLDGRVALVTGAGSGIGRASAERFAREGARGVCVDVSGEQEATAAERRFGRLDVLFDNAGIGGPKRPVTEQSEDGYARVLDVDLKSVFLGMKYGIEAMLRTGGGSVINTASAAGLVGGRNNALGPGMTWTDLVPAAESSFITGAALPVDGGYVCE